VSATAGVSRRGEICPESVKSSLHLANPWINLHLVDARSSLSKHEMSAESPDIRAQNLSASCEIRQQTVRNKAVPSDHRLTSVRPKFFLQVR
jgi:hypothetical protein